MLLPVFLTSPTAIWIGKKIRSRLKVLLKFFNTKNASLIKTPKGEFIKYLDPVYIRKHSILG